MNKSIFQLAAGFGAGYFTKTLLDERYKPTTSTATETPKSEMDKFASVMRQYKDVYESAKEHPERVPKAMEQARRALLEDNGNNGDAIKK